MDKIISPHSPEAAAHNHLQENWFSWDLDNINDGADLYIVPRTQADLENILKRYSYDAIHNAIAKSRSTLQPGGYSRVCVLAEKSIRGILNSGDNVNFLLGLHRRAENKTSPNGNGCPVPVISTEW
ncbi:hypothetical protein Agabi119p4_4539 [Agaricus bisporus var. burnettii]|uniref:Uncharacterized protein n=1 Tax=Agaricus bisporus var. burnettii TaxID=192524 RepID=A0A8H7KHD9_AGABI|nr:hypothetical protein Agabi119p4_4539 [Agaricus bisporus var. burnettii]